MKSDYSASMVTFVANNKAICAFLAGWIVILNPKLKELMYTTEALILLSNVALANSLLLMSLTMRAISRSFLVV